VQENIAQFNVTLNEIRVQIGEQAFTGVLERRIEVSGVIRAEDRTYTIILKDRETGKEIGRAVDVQRIIGNARSFDLNDLLEAPSNTPLGD
jgi:hypothetical protein